MEENQILSDDSLENESKWGINFESEKTLWSNIILNRYCYKPDICQTCFKGQFVLKEAKDPDILNLYYLRCNHTPCRKKNL